MSLRSIHLYGCNNSSVLIESTNNEKYLLLQQSGIIEIDKTLGNTLKSSYHKILDGFALLGILKLTEDLEYLALVTGVLSVGQLYNSDIYKISNVQFVPLNAKIEEPVDQRMIELQKLLSSGIFYFSNSADRQKCFNLSVSLQQKRNNQNSASADFRFYWNRNLTFPFDRCNIEPNDWCVKCICGSVLIRTIYLGHRTAKVAIISRLSCEHVGTRFNVRGINDEGNVANFVETEQIVIFEEQECSFLQIRGSIPLFWEQPGINVGSHVVKMKPLELSLVALERHFTRLKRFYGKILSVNLLSSKKGEFVLSNAFKSALKSSTHCVDVRLVSFDYHAEVKQSKESLKRLLKDISAFIDECNFFHQNGQSILSQQTGVIRTNCLDCLDRTNSVQTLIGMRAIVAQLTELGVEQYKANIISRVEEIIREMWQRNGDQCSVIYAGTGALEGKSKLKDAGRSIVRTIQNNLMDSAKQESFDLLLFGRLFGQRQFDKIFSLLPTNVLRANSYFVECPNLDEFVEREKEMCIPISLKIFTGTWNVNGGKNIYNVAYKDNNSLGPWIFPTNLLDIDSLNYDLIGIGLEEIVDLNASNLVKTSTTNQRIWCNGIKRIINEFQREHFGEKAQNFVVLCCEQLVGVCLILFVRSSLLASVKDVAIGEVKTGMGGATGNKGSIAVRMTINSTSVCFVCSHFAAGQNEIAARNSDYVTALKRIRFSMGRSVEQNDAIFWIGDFNYRISLNGEEVKNAIRANEFANLAENDQLTQQKEMGNIFVGFKEGPLHFAPTYKYDTFSDDYDTSEKCRSPAWTDRILWMDQNNLVRLIHYGRSELKTSDHRPVFAIFHMDTLKFDFQKAEPVLKDIIHSIGPPNPTIICSVSGHSQQFPQQFCKEIFSKIFELGSAILVSKIEGQFLHIVLGTGMDALAALSMDGLTLSDGQKLEVKLAANSAQQWPENVLAELDAAIEVAKQEIVVPPPPIVAELCALNVVNNLDGEDSDEDDQCQQNAANGSQRTTPIHHHPNVVSPDQQQYTIPTDIALIDFSDVPQQF